MANLTIRYKFPLITNLVAVILAFVFVELLSSVDAWVPFVGVFIYIFFTLAFYSRKKIIIGDEFVNNFGTQLPLDKFNVTEITNNQIVIHPLDKDKWIFWKAKSFKKSDWETLTKAMQEIRDKQKKGKF